MAPGTSPRPLGTASIAWTAAEHIVGGALARAGAWIRFDVPRIARIVCALHLSAIVLILTAAWQPIAPSGVAGTVPELHLAWLMATGAAAAILTLTTHGNAGVRYSGMDQGLGELMAQMSHELRTPLNAVIGFSDVMLQELHGPLGNARYQEYAQHISDSGGRLLKSSEDALAVTHVMTTLLAERTRGRPQRSVASTLLREAWGTATAGAAYPSPRLAMTMSNTCGVLGERRAIVQALEHVFREALARAPERSVVEVEGRRREGRLILRIRVAQRQGMKGTMTETPVGNSLRVILARLLLQAQGATFSAELTTDGSWSAKIAFPPQR
jgi:signal transduction histidine kinase